MFGKILKNVLRGIAWGCVFSTVICMMGVALNGESWLLTTQRGFVAQCLASMIVGIAWVVPSMVYQDDRLSLAQQALIHFSIGFVVYFPTAIYMGWIPSNGSIGQILTEVLMIMIFSVAVWFGFYFYYRRLAKRINDRIRKITK